MLLSIFISGNVSVIPDVQQHLPMDYRELNAARFVSSCVRTMQRTQVRQSAWQFSATSTHTM